MGAVVLAAGAGSRFGGPKQRLLLPAVLAALRRTSVTDVVVVGGAHPLEEPAGARLVHCPEWERGPGASLRCGLAALPPEAEAAVVVLADGPRLAPEVVERVVTAWRESGSDLLAATYGSGRSHPLLVGRALWHEVPDEGLRVFAPLLVPCDDLEAPGDVDTPEDLP